MNTSGYNIFRLKRFYFFLVWARESRGGVRELFFLVVNKVIKSKLDWLVGGFVAL